MTENSEKLPVPIQLILLFALPEAIILVDFATKQIALATIFNPPRVVEVLPFFNFAPVWNSGVSFGLLQNAGAYTPWILAGFALAVGLFLPWYSRHWPWLGRTGAQLMAGGAIGNAIDRVIYGRVVDFFDFHAAGWHWPAFNVADIAITVGAGLILIDTVANTYFRNSSAGSGDQ